MCGRYYIDDETYEEIEDLVQQNVRYERNHSHISAHESRREIYPTDVAPVVYQENFEKGSPLVAGMMKWGFPGYGKSKVIFNARAESALERKSFAESVKRRRIVIPANGFYEWNQEKEKVEFSRGNGTTLYLAGFENRFDNQECYVILTTQANESMISVHNRMPLILEQGEIEDWIQEEGKLAEFLGKRPGQLISKMEYEQQSFL